MGVSVNMNDLAIPWWCKLDVSAYTCEVVANDITSRSNPRSPDAATCNLRIDSTDDDDLARSLASVLVGLPPLPSAHVVSIHPPPHPSSLALPRASCQIARFRPLGHSGASNAGTDGRESPVDVFDGGQGWERVRRVTL